MPPWSSMYIDAPTSSGEEPSTCTSRPATTRATVAQPAGDGGGGVLYGSWSSVSPPRRACRRGARSGRGRLRAPRPGYSARTPSHASIRLEKSVHRLSIGKLEPNIARPEPKRVEHDLGHVGDQLGVDAVDERALAGELDVDVRVLARAACSASRHGSPAIGMPGVDQHERQVGVRRRPARSADASWFGKTCSSKTQPELGQLREVLVERTGPTPGRAPVAKRYASCLVPVQLQAARRASAAMASACASSVVDRVGREQVRRADDRVRPAGALVLLVHPLDLVDASRSSGQLACT